MFLLRSHSGGERLAMGREKGGADHVKHELALRRRAMELVHVCPSDYADARKVLMYAVHILDGHLNPETVEGPRPKLKLVGPEN
ncbi:hypothetical protein ACLBYG_21925 [Methylobacterium sp. D53M]